MSDCCSKNSTQQHSDRKLHVAIIGSGSGAFACAIRAAEAGARVTIIESGTLGGCCVNVGCVPSKILIRAAHIAQHQRQNPFEGLENQAPKVNRKMLAQQQQTRVDELRLAKYENILAGNPALTLVKGLGEFKNSKTLLITKPDGTQTELKADRILIATGSKAFIPPIEGITSVPYWTSTEALFAEVLPKHLVVIGSSVVAVEIAQAYQRLGTQVTLVARHSLLYKEDPALGEALQQAFEAEGMTVLTDTQAQSVTYENKQFELFLSKGKLVCDQLLIAAGRSANTCGLNLERAAVAVDQVGAVVVDDRLQTNVEHIYSVGDCSTMPQFVYVAAAAGTRAAINMTGGDATLDLSTMPAVIFTDPQVATVGLTEVQAKNQSINTISRYLDLINVPRALANFDTRGFVKLVVNSDNQQLIGAQIVAEQGGEMIQTATLAIHNKMTIDALAGQLFPYLTMVEGLKLCAQTFAKDVSQLSCCAG
ncbi:MAG: mercury(II) reductase [Algicola sp.]|nr:mercury(II) reductase [Algicola sp.]